MRRTFRMGAWDETLGAFHRLGDLICVRTGVRIEAPGGSGGLQRGGGAHRSKQESQLLGRKPLMRILP